MRVMKKAFIIFAALSAVNIILVLTGLAGLDTNTGGIVYRLVIIAALLFCSSCVFTGAAKRGGIPLLSGALGLGLLAVSELYTFAYIYLLQGESIDITVSNYIRPCAYLFIMLTVLEQLSSKRVNILRKLLSALSIAALLLIFYSVIANNLVLLSYSALSIAALCILSAVFLLLKSKRLFALSVIAFCLLDIANRLMVLYPPGWLWHDMVLVFYPPVYLWLGWALLKGGEENE